MRYFPGEHTSHEVSAECRCFLEPQCLSDLAARVSIVSEVDVTFCFYDDAKYVSDADGDSYILQEWHRQLWSKDLPSGEKLQWVAEPGEYLTSVGPHGPLRVSSDTIATTHARYAVIRDSGLWADLSPTEQEAYERAFYTIGGFIIFPVRSASLNQQRGQHASIADRFDLTLECIRQHYLGQQDNPLSDALEADVEFFRLFGEGSSGFRGYVDFFHLQDLVDGDSIRWWDGLAGSEWDFGQAPIPQSPSAYRRYLDNVAAFVSARNGRIEAWLAASRDG